MIGLFFFGYRTVKGWFEAHFLGCGIVITEKPFMVFRLTLFYFPVIEVGQSLFNSKLRLFDVKIF